MCFSVFPLVVENTGCFSGMRYSLTPSQPFLVVFSEGIPIGSFPRSVPIAPARNGTSLVNRQVGLFLGQSTE